MEIRLNKFISQSGCCSRRKADRYILEGKVKVNGVTVRNPALRVNPIKDKVYWNGNLIKPKEKKIYLKLYKPPGYLTELGKDKFGRKSLTDLYNEVGIQERLFPAGRLDYDSEGLLVITNDGDFANILMHPRKKIKKKYVVEVAGRVGLESFNRIKKGTNFEGIYLKPDKVRLLRKRKNSTIMEITIHTGQKRVIRRYMKMFGHPVLKLKRTEIGLIKLEKLKPKEWEKIPIDVVNRIKSKYVG